MLINRCVLLNLFNKSDIRVRFLKKNFSVTIRNGICGEVAIMIPFVKYLVLFISLVLWSQRNCAPEEKF